VEDPRQANKRHRLLDILVIAICAVIGNADDWVDIEEFGKAKKRWFRQFLSLPHGIPSQHTFRRVFCCCWSYPFVEQYMPIIRIPRGSLIL
jgi:hypothetical protein